MIWTIETAKKWIKKLNLDLDVTEKNLDEVAKKIRKVLRQRGMSIRDQDIKETPKGKPKIITPKKSLKDALRERAMKPIPSETIFAKSRSLQDVGIDAEVERLERNARRPLAMIESSDQKKVMIPGLDFSRTVFKLLYNEPMTIADLTVKIGLPEDETEMELSWLQRLEVIEEKDGKWNVKSRIASRGYQGAMEAFQTSFLLAMHSWA